MPGENDLLMSSRDNDKFFLPKYNVDQAFMFRYAFFFKHLNMLISVERN